METKGSKKRRFDEGPSAANGGVVTMEDVQRLIDREQASMRHKVDALEEANAALKTKVEELKLETEDLRRRCAVNARSIQVLKKDVKWTYSAPDIPRSHWLNQGHGDQYIAEMTKIVKGIKRSTEKLRNGAVNDLKQIFLKTAVSLAHDDILLPHWSELSDAIQLLEEGAPLTFAMNNVQVNRSVQEMLSQSLVLKCDQIGLYRNHFNRQDGANFACEAIRNNPQLNVFGFQNAIESEESADRLCRLILAHPKIQRLCLGRCCNEGGTFGYSMLKTLMSSPARKFVRLYLGGNHIRTNGCSILPDYIASNPPLEVLALNDNHLVDDDLRMISMALKTNDRLKELHLKRNDNTPIGTKWLEVAVRGLRPIQTASGSSFLDPSFESVFDCNHTCRIEIPESSFEELNCSSPLENKMRKLYDLIVMHSLRGDLVNELQRALGGDLISLMPFGLLQVPPRGLPQQSQVHRPADEAVAVVKHLPSPPPAGPEPGQHAFAALQNRPFRGRDQVPDFPVVEPPRLADAARQVERAEEHGVHARHRGDLGYRLDAPGALDLDHHQQLLPTPGHVVRVGPVAARPHEGERAAPHAVDGIRGVVDLAGVPRGRHGPLGSRGVLDHGNEDAAGEAHRVPANEPWAAPRRVDRLQQGLAARAVRGAVLVVDDKVAVAGRGEELGQTTGLSDMQTGP
ncbi:hypothetical protein THAOC_17619 [Thalassiosira oceanica]|uniref:Uncharacterized protein n=1 Tax=Thalassiosira oceanica TaxID=159749 RepID=K0S6V6_THAOC|nr:hypothetical protein THAOC_17619 [Thalassiosira oceanica]|eukprot:EJK61823.1 hypothetical protein THAOC_17619 [Thalassiosira oceanica]